MTLRSKTFILLLVTSLFGFGCSSKETKNDPSPKASAPTAQAIKQASKPVIKEVMTSGLITVPSANSGQKTFERLKATIEAKGPLTIMGTVDHGANAKKAALNLAPTWVVLFGNPKMGTPMMVKRPTMGLSLPQRMLVYEREGKAYITYNDPVWVAKRHNLTGEEARLKKISALLASLAKAAAAP